MNAVVAALAALLAAVAVPAHAPAGEHRTVVLDERQEDTTVRVHPGDRVRIVLHSTYWTIGAAHSKALRATGPQRTAVRGGGCVPGAGCGTVTRTFVARAPGRARLVATRTTCGEALRCTGGQGSYEVSVRVLD